MAKSLLRISQAIFNSPLMIVPEKLEAILWAIGPRLDTDQSSLRSFLASRPPRSPSFGYWDASVHWDDDEDDYDSTPKQAKKPYEQTDAGVAIISVKGVLMKEGGWMSALSGCSSYASIKKATIAAMDDPTVRAVLFNVDSPGGTTHGCFELSDLIHSFRGKKPTLAIANDLAASAAYALASSADRVVLTRTAGVGSIGVFCLHCDQSSADGQAGVKYTYIFAGEHKVDGNPHEPLSKSAYASVKAEVDREYGIFVATVARNRGVDPKSVIGTKAEVLFDPLAIPLLADSVGTYDSALADLTDKITGSSATIFLSLDNVSVTSLSGDKDKDMATTTTTTALTIADLRKQAETANLALAAAEKLLAPLAPTIPVPSATTSSPDDPEKLDDGSDDEDDDDKEMCDNPNHPDGCNHADGSADDYETKQKALTTMPDKTIPVVTAAPVPVVTVSGLTAAEMSDIVQLCAIAGLPELSADFVLSNKPVAEVRKILMDKRAAMSQATSVHSGFGAVSSAAADAISQQAAHLVQSSNGRLSRPEAIAQVIAANPRLYDDYQTQRGDAIASPPSVQKTYMSQLRERLVSMGLSPGQQ